MSKINSGTPSSGPGSGDVVGPASSTDNALSRFDGTTGKLLQDSTVIVTDAGEMTNSSQPAFLANLASTDANVTGNGTIYSLGSGTALTEIYDQNSDFDPGDGAGSAATFTAPVTGKYYIGLKINATDFGASSADCFFRIVTSNRTYESNLGTFVSNTRLCVLSVIADMDAGDTATFEIESIGVGADNVDLIGAADGRTLVNGYLVA
ncbi:MAG: hypothetical protein PVF17_00635 [Ignavibacteria bacterium]|jgi:hypothetical protein